MTRTYTIMEHVYTSGYDDPIESQSVFLTTSKRAASQKLKQLREESAYCSSQRFVSVYELKEE
jgi:hypothetical protein